MGVVGSRGSSGTWRWPAASEVVGNSFIVTAGNEGAITGVGMIFRNVADGNLPSDGNTPNYTFTIDVVRAAANVGLPGGPAPSGTIVFSTNNPGSIAVSSGDVFLTPHLVPNGTDYLTDIVLGIGDTVIFKSVYTHTSLRPYEYLRVATTSGSIYRIWVITAPIHRPTVTIQSPGTNVSSVEPIFKAQFSDPSHAKKAHRIRVKSGSTIVGDTGVIEDANSIIQETYTSDNFAVAYNPLVQGGTYVAEFTGIDTLNYPGITSSSFKITPLTTKVTITKPDSGLLDLTPQFVAIYDNSYGYGIEETLWKVYRTDNNQLIGQTQQNINDLTPTYDGAPTTWLTYTPLQYGQTYLVTAEVKDDVFGQWSAPGSRTFTVGAYEPTATITAPSVKIDTLFPSITGVFTSDVGNTKTGHRVHIYSGDGSVLFGTKEVLGNTTSPFTEVYQNDGTWTSYTPLQWATTYRIVIQVRDNENIWSSLTAASAVRNVATNSAPTASINLLPNNNQNVTTLQPILSAEFQDPNTGDTPAAMEVELRRVSDNVLVMQRSESDNDESFHVFLSDGLTINTNYTWRVRFTDQGNLLGAWSNWATFVTREGVSVTLTNPTAFETFTSPVQTFTWTYAHPTGVAQSNGRLRIYNETGNTTIYDSGVVAGSYTSQAIPVSLLKNQRTYRVTVDVTDVSGDSASTGFVYFSTLWTGPPQPSGLFVAPQHDDGYVQILWDQATINDFVAYRIYRRTNGSTEPFLLVAEIGDLFNTRYDYYFAPSGVPYDYAVTLTEDSTGAEIESLITTFVTETLSFPHDTWLNENFNPALYKIKLRYNPSRSDTYERQATFVNALGRRAPVAHIGKTYNQQLRTSFLLRQPYKEQEQMLIDMIERGRAVLYRDGRGRRRWVALLGYELTDVTANRVSVSLTFTTISVEDR